MSWIPPVLSVTLYGTDGTPETVRTGVSDLEGDTLPLLAVTDHLSCLRPGSGPSTLLERLATSGPIPPLAGRRSGLLRRTVAPRDP